MWPHRQCTKTRQLRFFERLPHITTNEVGREECGTSPRRSTKQQATSAQARARAVISCHPGHGITPVGPDRTPPAHRSKGEAGGGPRFTRIHNVQLSHGSGAQQRLTSAQLTPQQLPVTDVKTRTMATHLPTSNGARCTGDAIKTRESHQRVQQELVEPLFFQVR